MALPGETILVAAALLSAATNQIDIAVVVAAAAAGAIVGDGIGYTVGRRFGMPLLRKYGRYIRLDENQRTEAEINGNSQRMLTLTLRNLERDGLIKRQVFPTVPPRVDYLLTPLGRTLMSVLNPLRNWAMENRPEIESARMDFDGRKDADMLPIEG